MAPRPPPFVLAAVARQVARRLNKKNSNERAQGSGALAAQSSEAITQWLVDLALAGFGPMESAHALARRYQRAPRLKSTAARLDAMVRQEANKSFAAGFVTSLPVPIALPAMVPMALLTTWLIQARMVAAMAIISGHDPKSPWVRTTILLALDDANTPRALKEAGLNPGDWAAMGMAQHLAQPMMDGLWRKASEALLRQASRRGWARVGRFVPLLGAVLAGGLDAYGCRQVAARSRSLIVPPDRMLT